MSDYSLSDIKSILGDGSSMGGGAMLILIILFLFFMRGGIGEQGSYATQADVNAALAAQTSALNQQQILLSSTNNNFEVAKLISDQNMAMVNQNNANQINVIQGFNAITQQMANQTSVLSNKLDQLGFAMEQCCCSVKTLIKDNQISDLTNQLNNANNIAVNAAQTQQLLGAMGKWVANPAATTA